MDIFESSEDGLLEVSIGDLIVRLGHGECDECDVDLRCGCEREYRIHWCRKHSAMESE